MDDHWPEPVPDRLLRIGDAERDRAASALGEHFAAGRLERAELDSRLEAVYAARTQVDLDRQFVDLPQPSPFRSAGAPQRRRQSHVTPARVLLPILPLLVVGLIVASLNGFPPFFLIPLFWVWCGVRRRSCR